MLNPLKKKRVSLGKTQQQIADVLGVDARNISQYELDKRCPHLTDLLAVAKAYQLTDKEIMEYIKYVTEIKK